MDAGSCTLYDSRLLHGGGPNTSPPDREARWLLYFSFSPSEALAAELRVPPRQAAGGKIRSTA